MWCPFGAMGKRKKNIGSNRRVIFKTVFVIYKKKKNDKNVANKMVDDKQSTSTVRRVHNMFETNLNAKLPSYFHVMDT